MIITPECENTTLLPVLPVRGFPVFPDMIIHFEVGRDKSINAISEAMAENKQIFLVAQKDYDMEFPKPEDLYRIGTIANIKQIVKISETDMRVLVEGVKRGELVNMVRTSGYFEGEVCDFVTYKDYTPDNQLLLDAYGKKIKGLISDYYALMSDPNMAKDALMPYINETDIEKLGDAVSANVNFSLEKKQELLQTQDLINRLGILVEALTNEIVILGYAKHIDKTVKAKLNENQREFYLKEQLHIINEELGLTDADYSENYISDLKARGVPEYVIKKAEKELKKLDYIQPNNPDYSVILNYLEWIEGIGWEIKSEENNDFSEAQKILDADHWGLTKVKERIIEFLAVRKLTNGKKSPIICLVGPPGVGKTSIAKSIAKVLNREYVRLSLGGVHDEAEIRGHRRTYIGAMPGRIVTSLKKAGTMNPLILLDEIDKLGQDVKGSPSSALLEVLDSEQNFAFHDNFMDIDIDLSDVMFVTTANTLETIEKPLLDRMEVIELSSYTYEDKKMIAEKYLIPKQMENAGIKKSNLKFGNGAIEEIINCYTREAGVRELERKIEQIMRKCAKNIIVDGKKSMTVSNRNIENYLGKRIYIENDKQNKALSGVVCGLAWTQFGGDTLKVEVNVMEGTGKLLLTGHLGDVMKESAKTAVSYIRSNSKHFGIDNEFYKKYDIHIHVPEGAVPKDGPSAGITMCTALISALTGKKVRHDVAMTGEITLTGRILPIGGLKEKAMAAYRDGVKTVLIPEKNVQDIEDIPQTVSSKLEFVVADNMDTVLKTAFI